MNSVRSILHRARPLFLSALTGLLLTSCSTTYTLKDFPSEEKYFEHFNNSANDKSDKIILKGDSLINYSRGVLINRDSLVLKDYTSCRENKTLLLEDLKKIDYYNTDFKNPSAYLELKDGQRLNAEGIKILRGKIKFTNIISVNKCITIKQVDKVYYENRWATAGKGITIGTFVSVVLFVYGILPPYKHNGWNNYLNQRVAPRLTGLLIWPALGSVIGYLIGHTYTFKFDP